MKTKNNLGLVHILIDKILVFTDKALFLVDDLDKTDQLLSLLETRSSIIRELYKRLTDLSSQQIEQSQEKISSYEIEFNQKNDILLSYLDRAKPALRKQIKQFSKNKSKVNAYADQVPCK